MGGVCVVDGGFDEHGCGWVWVEDSSGQGWRHVVRWGGLEFKIFL